MDTKTRKRLQEAADSLEEMLEGLEPYIKRPVVEELSTHGKWTRGTVGQSNTPSEEEEKCLQSVAN